METTFCAAPVFINKNGRLYKVMPTDIICIVADRAYCNIFVVGRKDPYELPYSMGHVLKAIPDGLLTHVGRSLALNISHIKEVASATVTMDNEARFIISTNAMNELRNKLVTIGGR